MYKMMLDWFRSFVDKRICTVPDFEKAVTFALKEVAKDQDGFLSVKEAVRLIVKMIRTART